MDVPPLLLQTLGSLVAIFLLAGLAALLKLGGAPRLESDADVGLAASEVSDGFEAAECEASRDGSAALARDASGRVMLIKRHGNRFAGRILTAQANASFRGDMLAVECGERRFGAVLLALEEPAFWKAKIDAISES
jgi:hypothetical protein